MKERQGHIPNDLDKRKSVFLGGQRTVIHLSALPYFTVDAERRAGMPSLRKSVQEFAKRGWRVLFVYPVDAPKNSYEEGGIEFFPIYLPLRNHHQRKSNSTFWGRLRARLHAIAYIAIFPFKIWPLLSSTSFHLLYAHSAPAVVVGSVFRLVYKTPLVARLYGISSPDSLLGDVPFSLRRFYWDFYEILALKVRANLYMITDDGTRGQEVLLKYGLSNQGLVLRNGVDVPERIQELPRVQLRRELGLHPEMHVITFVGRIECWKRPDRILKVALESRAQKRPWTFVLVGDGRDKVLLENQSKQYHLGRTIRFVGAVAHEEVWKHLLVSDVFLSLHDLSSISNTLLEALALDIPVVCSRKGEGIEELVIDGFSGYLVNEPDNAKAVIEAIDKGLRIPKSKISRLVDLQAWEDRLETEFSRIEDILIRH